jgi:hypothetical protein
MPGASCLCVLSFSIISHSTQHLSVANGQWSVVSSVFRIGVVRSYPRTFVRPSLSSRLAAHGSRLATFQPVLSYLRALLPLISAGGAGWNSTLNEPQDFPVYGLFKEQDKHGEEQEHPEDAVANPAGQAPARSSGSIPAVVRMCLGAPGGNDASAVDRYNRVSAGIISMPENEMATFLPVLREP